jgi:hypothetical protein
MLCNNSVDYEDGVCKMREPNMDNDVKEKYELFERNLEQITAPGVFLHLVKTSNIYFELKTFEELQKNKKLKICRVLEEAILLYEDDDKEYAEHTQNRYKLRIYHLVMPSRIVLSAQISKGEYRREMFDCAH